MTTSDVVAHDREELIMKAILDEGDLPSCDLHTRKEILLKGIYDQLEEGGGGVTDEHINELIDAKLGVIENGTY